MWLVSISTDHLRAGSRLGAPSWKRFLPRLVLLLYVTAEVRGSRGSPSDGLMGGGALGLQCPPCERVHCSPRRPSRLRCRGGVVRGVCNCCPVCAKLEGDPCGGQWNYLGTCDVGLYCDTASALRPPIFASKTAPSPDNYKDTDSNLPLKTEGYCRKGGRFSLLSLSYSYYSEDFRKREIMEVFIHHESRQMNIEYRTQYQRRA